MYRPSTLDELRGLVASAKHIRAAGTGHSFNAIADSAGDLVSLAAMPADFDIDGATVRVAAGMTYGELATRLHAAGWAVPNMASLPHISVGGAIATGTHGSGTRNLAASVSALEIVGPDGALSRVDRSDPHFAGSVVSLGALGIVTHVTLDLVPTFTVWQRVYLDVPRSLTLTALQSAYSASLFTDLTSTRFTQLWLKTLDDTQVDWATPAGEAKHPIDGIAPDACTEQLGVPGPWHERLPHFRLSHTPSAGEELQSEYFVPLESGPSALDALDRVRDAIRDVLLVSEIRLVRADDLWLSPAYGRDSMAIHFTWKLDRPRVTALLPHLEECLAPFDFRPHWGKMFHAEPTYPRQADFAALVASRDPAGKFRNDFVRPWTTPRL